MAEKIKSPCQGCNFMVLHDPESRPAETLICVDCIRKGFTVEHLAERIAEEVMSLSASEPDDSTPTIDTESSASRQHRIDTGEYLDKEDSVTDTDTVQDEQVEATEPETTEKPAKKSKAKADKAPKVPKEKKERKPASERRGRGLLEADVLTITDKFVKGDVTLGDDEALTPHRIANFIKDQDGLDEAPSTGAVAAVLARWDKYGFVTLSDKPVAFASYTEAGVSDGLTALKAKHAEDRKAARAEAKKDTPDNAGSDGE
jgi:hypothetical protein